MPHRLTRYIVVGLLSGLAVGWACHAFVPERAAAVSDAASLLPTIFLRLIKMIIAPLVFSTLVVGIAKMNDVASVGRIGGKALAWFIAASLVSLSLGLVLVNTLEPGKAIALPAAAAHGAPVEASALTLSSFITHVIPTSILDAMARNEILQIVVFSLFFGSALAALGERTRAVVDVIDAVSHVMLKVTSYVMLFAPFAVFGALIAAVATNGLDVIAAYGLFIGEFYAGLALLWLLLLAFGSLAIGPSILHLIRRLREPILLAFSTASSEAAYPKMLEELERFGCPNRIASFVLPMGYSFNLDGSMMYCTFAVMFIAQMSGIEISFGQQLADGR